jgi:L-alanine-DL-glutamate epimerase-like enolase superfamily enzyme
VSQVPVERVTARAFTVPTDASEADGTLSWDSTTVVLVQASAGGHTGVGYSYAAGAAAPLVRELLMDAVLGGDALSPPAAWTRMRRAVRNIGYPGVASSAISAVDVALWDLKARLLGVALSTLLGRVRERVPVYGLSAHTSPTIHAHVCAAIEPLAHVEYFHDHARIEAMLFKGIPPLVDGTLCPDHALSGTGLRLREDEAERYEH